MKKGTKKTPYELGTDKHGHPVIPDLQGLSLQSKKSVIRSFLTEHYSTTSTFILLPAKESDDVSRNLQWQV